MKSDAKSISNRFVAKGCFSVCQHDCLSPASCRTAAFRVINYSPGVGVVPANVGHQHATESFDVFNAYHLVFLNNSGGTTMKSDAINTYGRQATISARLLEAGMGYGFLWVICATVGCSSPAPTSPVAASPESASPVATFDAVMSGIKKRATETREYMKFSSGVYTGGPHKGERYETFAKTKYDWEILGRDINKTDSVTSPYTAVVQYKRREHRAKNNPADWQQEWRNHGDALSSPYYEVVVDTRSARFVYKDGEWQCVADDADFPVVDRPTYQDQNPDSYKRIQ